MSIRWDPLLARHLAEELNNVLAGARLRALRFDERARDVVLLFRDRTLLWRLHPDRGFPLFHAVLEPDETDVGLKARVRRIYAPSDERVIIFDLLDERRGRKPLELIIELLGNQLNALVVEGRKRTIRHVLRRHHGRRPAVVGGRYTVPPPTGRLGADGTLSLERWSKILGDGPPEERTAAMTRAIAWTSFLNVEPFLLEDGHELWAAATSGKTPRRPVVIETDRGRQPYPFPLLGRRAREFGTLMAAFEACALERSEGRDPTLALGIGPNLMASLEDAAAHHERRVASMQAQLDGRQDAVALRRMGDLILARYTEVTTGVDLVTLVDFAGKPVSVELDPALAPHENASRYYGRAARSERAAARLPRLIEKASADRDRIHVILEQARLGLADAETVRTSLPRTSVLGGRSKAGPSLPYHLFRSSGGLEIRVGRGARHNDDLTFRHSAPDDVWLHARHMAGAHVILRWSMPGTPPAHDLREAGALAALHSKARTSSTVPVDWTFRRYVRKPRRAAPGSVLPDRVQTVFVIPDPALLEALAEKS